MTERRAAADAAVARTELTGLLEQSKGRVPPGLDPMGQCPYCHRDLMKRQLRLPSIMRKFVQTFAQNWDVLLEYWVCMNEECCLMFWRHPRTGAPHWTDDCIEH